MMPETAERRTTSPCAFVTGAAGFIGRALVAELLHHGYTVYAMVRDPGTARLPPHSHCRLITCDLEHILTLPHLLSGPPPGLCFHLAWAGSIGPQRADLRRQLQNVQWAVDTLHAAVTVGCRRFVFIGSIAQDEALAVGNGQNGAADGHYHYGMAKTAAGLALTIEGIEAHCAVIRVKLTNGYGVGDFTRRMLNNTLHQCLAGAAPSFTSGTQNYDFVYISDLVSGLRLAGERGLAGQEYLIGSGQARPLKNLLTELQRAVFPQIPFRFGSLPYQGINLPLSSLSIAAAREDLGYTPQISFAVGCQKTVQWLQELDRKQHAE